MLIYFITRKGNEIEVGITPISFDAATNAFLSKYKLSRKLCSDDLISSLFQVKRDLNSSSYTFKVMEGNFSRPTSPTRKGEKDSKLITA